MRDSLYAPLKPSLRPRCYSMQFVMTEMAIGRFFYVGGEEFNIDGQPVKLDAWKGMVRKLPGMLYTDYCTLCDFAGVDEQKLRLNKEKLSETPSCDIDVYWFGVEVKNNFYHRHIEFAENALSYAFFKKEDGKIVPIFEALATYYQLLINFLTTLMAVLYFLGGQPPRGENDLWSLQYRNQMLQLRNLLFFDKTLVYLSSVHKTTWKSGTSAGIPHLFPWDGVGSIIASYLVFFRGLEIALAKRANYSEDVIIGMCTYVFQCMRLPLGMSHFSSWLKVKTTARLALPHEGLGLSDCRQISIYMGKRWINPLINTASGDYGAILNLQAGHSSSVARAFYGIESEHALLSNSSDFYLSIKVVCFAHHHFYGIADQSSAESEYTTAAATGCEIMWMRDFLDEIGYDISGPSTLYLDSNSALQVAENPEHQSTMKHVNRNYHWIRAHVADGDIRLIHIPGTENVADIFTKPLGFLKFSKFRALLGLHE